MATEAKIVLSAVDQTKAAFADAQRNMRSLGDQAGTLAGRFGTIGLAISAAFSGVSLKGAIDVLDTLDDLREKTGIATEELSALRYAGEVTGTPFETLSTGLASLAKNMALAAGGNSKAQAAFNALGVSVKNADGTLRATDAVLLDVADRFAGYEDSAAKAAMAGRVFSDTGQGMIPLLNQGSDGIRQLRTEAQQLGAVYGGDLAEQAAKFNDDLARLSLTAEAAKVSLVGSLLPALNDVIKAMIRGRQEAGFLGMLSEGIKTLFTGSDLDKNNKALTEQTEQLLNLENALQKLRKAGFDRGESQEGIESSAAVRSLRTQISQKQEQLKLTQTYRRQLQAEVDLEVKAAEERGKKPKTAAPVARSGKAEPVDRFADNLISQLIAQYANLSGTMTTVDEVTRKLDATTKGVTDSERARALELAELIDAEKKRIANADQAARSIAAELDARERLQDAHYAAMDTLQQMAERERFELSLLGKLPDVIEAARFARELDVQVRTAEAALVARGLQEGWNENRMLEERARILREATDARDAFDKRQADARDKAFNQTRGVRDAIDEYLEGVRRLGDATRDVVANGFKTAEDALVSFVTKGKVDIKSLANSIIADLARIQIRQSIMGPIAQSLQSSGGMGGGGLMSAFTDLFFTGFGNRGMSWSYDKAGGGWAPPNSLQRVNERGPELLEVGGRQFLMMGREGGNVVPNGQAMGGVGGLHFAPVTPISIGGGLSRAEFYTGMRDALAERDRMWSEQLRQLGVIV